MLRPIPIGVLVCSLAVTLISCSEDSPTSISDSASDSPTQPEVAASRGPKTHPGKIVEQVTTPAAWGVAVRDDGLTYFTEPFADGAGITGTKTRTVDGFIPTGARPIGAAFSPDGGRAYITNLFGHTVSVIDASSAQVTATISTGDLDPTVVQVSPEGGRLYIAGNNNAVLVVETATNQVINTIAVGYAPNGFAVHPDGRRIYVSSFFNDTDVSEIDMATGRVLRTFPLEGSPQEMALNRKGTRLYVANEAGYLNEIDLASGRELPRIPLAAGGFGVGVTPDDGEAYVSEPSAGLVQVFTLQTRRLKRTINVGGEPRRLGFSQRGKIAAIANMAGYVTFVR